MGEVRKPPISICKEFCVKHKLRTHGDKPLIIQARKIQDKVRTIIITASK